MIKKLLYCGVTQQQIVVLCPYRAQCYIIQEDLTKNEFSEVSVSSIVKSQGRLNCIKRDMFGSICHLFLTR